MKRERICTISLFVVFVVTLVALCVIQVPVPLWFTGGKRDTWPLIIEALFILCGLIASAGIVFGLWKLAQAACESLRSCFKLRGQ